MKKIVIGIIIAALVGIVIYNYLPRKTLNKDMLSNKTQITSSTTSEEGMSLPIKDKEVDELSLVEKSTITVEQIIKDYKLKWNPFGIKNELIDTYKSNEIYKMLLDYKLCSAVKEKKRDICNDLPSDNNRSRLDSPKEACFYKYDTFMLTAISSGKTKKDEKICKDYMSTHKFKDELSVGDFCNAVSNGYENFCASVKKIISDNYKINKLCKGLPERKEDIRDIDIKNLYILQSSLKNGNIKTCPKEYKSICSQFIYNDDSCEVLKGELVNKYRNYLLDALKKQNSL